MSNTIKMLQNLLLLLLLPIFLHCFPILIQGSESDQYERKPYIIYMGALPTARAHTMEQHHYNMLEAAIGNKQLARESKIHSYGKSFNGFVARLLPHEAEKLKEEDNVVSVFRNTYQKLHTTRSWDFIGMPLKLKRNLNIESHIIVGVLDTGIFVDCPSFNDEGFGPPPRRWKGKCVTGANFTGCNNKVIGAKYFNLDQSSGPFMQEPSPVDDQGHGTHTASTVAGSVVRGASLYGIGEGTARGGVPSARIAMYKVCWSAGCSDMDMLAAFDEAIADGVNFISVSIGGPSRDFFSDPIAIGSFHAMRRGVLTSCSGGNDGPRPMSVENVAPWIMTVAATTLDRQFITLISFGDGKNVTGISINTFSPGKKMYPLTSGILAANLSGDSYGNPSGCDYGTLDKSKVMGRIVYCSGGTGSQDLTIKNLGGAGTIIALDGEDGAPYTTVISGAFVDIDKYGKNIETYINITKNPQAVIYKTTAAKFPAPYLASFSSKGPQQITNNILKPDLAAPGLDILAGYSKLATLTGYAEDNRYNIFNILSGTSMACPHATAAAVYIKSFHPDWSAAAIKSALMTTATPVKANDNYTELGAGSGQISPVKALHPGLLYDIRLYSYVAFLCKQDYNSSNIGILIGRKNFNCSSVKPAPGTDGINYPTMHIQLQNETSSISAVFYRTVTNVGFANSTYKAKVTAPEGLSVEVIPNTLKFSWLHQVLGFKVILKGPPPNKTVLSASLEWNDSHHSVRSPIVIFKPTVW